MPWYPDDYDDNPSEQDNSWDDMQDVYYYEDELSNTSYSQENPLAGYDPDRMWGGSDQMSITAMHMGDPAAEIYCWDKANRLGGYPWDGAPTHPSYDRTENNKQQSGTTSNVLLWVILAYFGFIVLCFIWPF